MSESQLRQNILDEFEFDPSFNSGHIDVAVERDVVILTGHVISYAEKLAAIAATRRVKGVHAISEHIEVRYPFTKTADDQIAQRASDILDWNVLVPASSIEVQVEDGWLTLSGTVDWHYERAAAEDDVRKLAGVVGVTNNIVINNPLGDHSCIRAKTRIRARTPRGDRIQGHPRHREERQYGRSGRSASTPGTNVARFRTPRGRPPA